jgi:hypothetical protein
MTGITNAIFKAEVEGDPHAIIYRRFGDSKESNFCFNKICCFLALKKPMFTHNCLKEVMDQRFTIMIGNLDSKNS